MSDEAKAGLPLGQLTELKGVSEPLEMRVLQVLLEGRLPSPVDQAHLWAMGKALLWADYHLNEMTPEQRKATVQRCFELRKVVLQQGFPQSVFDAYKVPVLYRDRGPTVPLGKLFQAAEATLE